MHYSRKLTLPTFDCTISFVLLVCSTVGDCGQIFSVLLLFLFFFSQGTIPGGNATARERRYSQTTSRVSNQHFEYWIAKGFQRRKTTQGTLYLKQVRRGYLHNHCSRAQSACGVSITSWTQPSMICRSNFSYILNMAYLSFLYFVFSHKSKREAEGEVYKKYLKTTKTRYTELMLIVDNVVVSKQIS